MLMLKMFKKSTSNHHAAGRVRFTSLFILAVCLWLFCLVHPARAEVLTSGDVVPGTDPETWQSTTEIYIGKTGNGALNFTGGSGAYETAIGPTVAAFGAGAYITGDDAADSVDFNIGGDALLVVHFSNNVG